MKTNKNLLQVTTIVLVVVLLTTAMFFTFNYSAAKVSSTNLFDSTGSNLDGITSEITTPLSYDTRIAKGDSLFEANYFSLAATEYAFAINIQEENPEAHAKLGQTYLAQNEDEKAAQNLARAYQLAPENEEYKTQYALTLLRTSNLEKTTEILNESNKEDQTILFYSGILATFQHDYKQAEKDFQATQMQSFTDAFSKYSSQVEGDDVYLRALLTQSLSDEGEYRLAQNLATEVLNEKSDYRDVWILLGYAKLKLEDYQEAEDAFKQAKILDSVKPETHYFLATAHYMQEEYEEAIAEFELALLYDFEPEEQAYAKLAESQLFLENYAEALEAYEYLVKIDHESAESFVQPVWLAIHELKDLDRALTIAQEAQAMFPSESMSHNLTGWVYIERNELEEAEEALETALALDPDLPAAHYNTGLLYEKIGDIDAAKEALRDAYDLAGPSQEIGVMAAERYNALVIQEAS
jgi:tetratricopeptide (TPR) repeat protein